MHDTLRTERPEGRVAELDLIEEDPNDPGEGPSSRSPQAS